MKTSSRLASAFLLLAFALWSSSLPAQETPGPGWRSLDELAESRIAVFSGTAQDFFATATFPRASIQRFNSKADLVLAVKTGKVEVVIDDLATTRLIVRDNPDLAILTSGFHETPIGAAFRKGDDRLRQRFDRFLEAIGADGTLAAVQGRWLVEDPGAVVMPSIPVLDSGERLRVGVSPVIGLPFVSQVDGHFVGYDIELVHRFALREGLRLDIVPMEFDSLIAALAAGKIDMIASLLSITPERQLRVDFSAPYNHERSAALVLKKNLASEIIPERETAGQAASGQSPDAGSAKTAATSGGSRSFRDLATGRIAIFTGTVHERFLLEHYPQAEIVRLNGTADLVLSIKTNKVDAALLEGATARLILKTNPDLAILDEDIYDLPLGVAFRKDRDDLRERFNRFLGQIRANGIHDDMYRRWVLEDADEATMPEIPRPAGGERVRAGVSVDDLPYVAIANGQYTGFDIELLYRFAAQENLDLEIATYEWDALINALASGKADLVTDGIAISEERAKVVDFSDPYLDLHTVALMRADRLANAGAGAASGGWRSLDDLAEGRIAVFAGAIQDLYVTRTYPRARVIHLNGHADLLAALKAGKVDAGLIIATSAPELLRANPDLGLLGDPILPVPQAAAFRKEDRELRERFDRFLAGILADGTHAEMRARWFEQDAGQARLPEISLPETGPALRLGTSVFVGLPYVGMADGAYVGFDIELARRFAAHEGRRLELIPMEFSALIPALVSGKLDFIASALAVTEERQRQVAFSVPYAEVSSVTLALKKNLAAHAGGPGGAGSAPGEAEAPAPGWFDALAASVRANFIVEQRWKLILGGLWITVLLSVVSTLFGTLLGALICWLRMSGTPLLALFGSGYIFLIRGLPVLLLLMLIFYVAFASVNIDPLIVAAIAFGMNFAAYVAEMFRTGIESIDRGQTEAGIAMGFTPVQTFFRIVLPQATRRILPVYRGEFISMVKMTSIVGYIGVQDLTKAGDIIRSRTFEAFFPLLMVAAIYFLVIWVLGLVLDEIDRRTDPARRVKQG